MRWFRRETPALPTATIRGAAAAIRLPTRLIRRARAASQGHPAPAPTCTALVPHPRWDLIDALEARLGIIRRPGALDVMYDNSAAARKDVIRGVTVFLIVTALMRFLI